MFTTIMALYNVCVYNVYGSTYTCGAMVIT